MVQKAGHSQEGGEVSANTFSFILSALSLLSLWLMGNKNKLGIVVGLANQLLWVVYALMLKQYGLLIGVIAYTIIHIRNLAKWSKEK